MATEPASPLPDAPSSAFTAEAFGLRWGSDHDLREFAPAPPGPCDIIVTRVAQPSPRPDGRPINNGEIFADGARFRFGDTVFDTYGTGHILWSSPTAREVPAAFFGTVVSIMLAWRGMVPLHGSAVEIDGRALLIAGRAGAGKSTLCAALTERGARLISDDLTALMPTAPDTTPLLQPGRPAIRLVRPGRPSDDKALHPAPRVVPGSPVPFEALVLLCADQPIEGPAVATESLRRQLFRPRWMAALPLSAQRTATLFHAAQRLRVLVAPAVEDRPQMSAGEKADMVLAQLARPATRAFWTGARQ